MASVAKNLVLGSMAVAGLLALLAVVDMVTGFPFGGGSVGTAGLLMDVMFLVGAGLVIYLGWDSYQDLR